MNIAIITSAGSGKRLSGFVNKVFLEIGEKPIIERTISAFENCAIIDRIIVVARQEDLNHISFIAGKFKKVEKVVAGGKERQDSVYNGIKSIDNPKDDDIILMHNGANPFVSNDTILRCINEAEKSGVSVAAIKAADTIKEANDSCDVIRTFDRSNLWLIQTPQVMKYPIAKEAFDRAFEDGFYGTDDVMLAERLGHKVKIVESNRENTKITFPHDIHAAENLVGCARVGFGLDSHRFSSERNELVLCGVLFDGPGLEANSDGDVVLHSLFNAVSQAMGGMSIGHYADEMARSGITDSREYLKVAFGMLRDNNCRINNIGIMIECKTPRIDPKVEDMKASLEKLCGVSKDKIGITATSGEELSDFGRGLGIQVFSVVSISKND